MVIISDNHGLTTSNTLSIADNALVFTCAMDNNTSEHSYPRPSDPVSGQNIAITSVQQNTIQVNVGASPIVNHDVTDADYDPYTGELELTIGSLIVLQVRHNQHLLLDHHITQQRVL